MTENEAKSCIQGKLDCMNKCDVFDCKGTDECDGCNYCYSQGNFGEQKEAFETAIKALEEIQQYRALEQKLQSVYGEHDGLLEIIVNGLVRYENAPDKAIKAVLLTDDDVEKWEQYRAIGTVEELKSMKENGAFTGVELASLACMQMKLKDYQSIGTIEEFKALKEKEEPKRLVTREEKYPKNYGIYSTANRWCPCCKGLVFNNDWSIDRQKIMYMRSRCSCGQKLDWSE